MSDSPYIVTPGAVLRQTDTKETDRILTLLTPEYGKISVIARGVRRKSCRYSAAAQMLAYSEWSLYRRGDWYYVNEGTSIELFSGLQKDFSRLALGYYFAELTEAVTAEGEAAGELLRHLLNGLYALDRLGKPEKLVKAAFEFRALSLSGYEPLADGCAVCGAEQPESPLLDVQRGLLCCRACREKGGGLCLPLCADSLAALRHVLYGDDRRLYSFRLGEEALERFSAAAETFLTVQLERGFKTLDYYKSFAGAPKP